MTASRTGLLPALAAVLAVSVGPAWGSIIDFEPFSPNIYFDTETFDQAGYRMTVGGNFGAIDTAAGGFFNPPLAPTGNATQFYSGFNDSHLTVALPGGGVFALNGFDAGFVFPILVSGAGVDPGFIIAQAIDTSSNVLTEQFAFGPSASNGSFPFTSYTGAAFATFANIVSVEFYACTFDVNGNCVNVNENLSQFSIDNIDLAAVPAPSSLALAALGLAGLAWRKRRRRS